MNRVIRSLLPKAIKPHRVMGGPLNGALMVTSWHDYPAGITGRTERRLLAWFQANAAPGQTWVDVGAHYGYTAIALSRCVGPTGRVFAFEPVIASAGCVAQARALNGLEQLTVMPLGLGPSDTIASLRLHTTRGMADRTIDASDGHWTETIQVARFDWLWPLINDGNDVIHGIKIDVQGMELDVLLGMRETLRRCRPKLIIEFHRGVDRAVAFDLLSAAGYSIDPVPIETSAASGSSTREILDDCSYEFVKRER
jgi:FkbM family methyltransferase